MVRFHLCGVLAGQEKLMGCTSSKQNQSIPRKRKLGKVVRKSCRNGNGLTWSNPYTEGKHTDSGSKKKSAGSNAETLSIVPAEMSLGM